MMKKWYRSRRNQILICLVVVATCVVFNFTLNPGYIERDLDLTRSHLSLAGNTAQNSSASSKTEQNGSAASKTAQNGSAASKTSQNSSVASRNDSSDTVINYVDPNDKRSSIIRSIEVRLEESLKEDKGTGCEIPRLDPFAREVTQFDKNVTLVCAGRDWVKCYLHECKVVEEIHADIGNIECNYQDIIYMSDAKYVIGSSKRVQGREPYVLERSDHVRIMCTGKRKDNSQHIKWKGYGIGFRASSARVPAGGGRPVDVLIFGFDSTSKDAFIRKMPKSYKYLTEELRATVLNSYNIVGDGTPAALFPILTGKTELELPDLRRSMSKETLDGFPFIFYKLKQMGFHTAYFEDMPSIGTFQYRFNGFKRQPADHYLRAVFLDEGGAPSWYSSKPGAYCMGDTPRHRLMMNITEQFLQLPGSHFGFTFVADITHDDFNMLSTADGATERFLRALHHGGHLDRTLLFVMGDHGPRFANVRDTLQGKLEERLPLMAVRVPPALTRTRPDVLGALAGNAGVLTTPHDIHATILDALGLRHLANPYRVRGADLPRALSLLHPIPRSRSCSEAGIEPHWCACLTWQPLPAAAPLRARAAAALLDFLNSLTEPRRDVCMPRTLTEISWVMVQRANSRLLAFKGAKDNDGYTGHFDGKTTRTRDNYQIKMTVGPGHGVYEASATYLINEDKFLFDVRDVSRVSAYNSEPSCISESQPHLNKYCYCREHLATAAS